MEREQYLKNLEVPSGCVDVVLDTDTFNELDDQFAVALLLSHPERFHPVGFCAAPFLNANSSSPEDGMEKSYQELMKILTLMEREDLKAVTFRGSRHYCPDEKTPVPSEAARFLAETAEKYSPQNPLYIVAIGAITNVASAILLNPKAMTENTVIVWLFTGGIQRNSICGRTLPAPGCCSVAGYRWYSFRAWAWSAHSALQRESWSSGSGERRRSANIWRTTLSGNVSAMPQARRGAAVSGT